jgi:hypothetical protein
LHVVRPQAGIRQPIVAVEQGNRVKRWIGPDVAVIARAAGARAAGQSSGDCVVVEIAASLRSSQ